MPKDVKLVIGAGAGGGLVSWAYTILTGATFGLDNWTALPLCLILGTAAALVAVYVVTPTDVSKVNRLIGYAVLCGFLWKPVLDAGSIVINERIKVGQTTAQLQSQVAQLKTSTAAPAAIGAKANEAAGQAAQLLRASDRLDNPNLEKQASAQAAEAVEAIADKASANPAAATLALDEIRVAAEGSNNSDVAQLATEKMQLIEKAPRFRLVLDKVIVDEDGEGRTNRWMFTIKVDGHEVMGLESTTYDDDRPEVTLNRQSEVFTGTGSSLQIEVNGSSAKSAVVHGSTNVPTPRPESAVRQELTATAPRGSSKGGFRFQFTVEAIP